MGLIAQIDIDITHIAHRRLRGLAVLAGLVQVTDNNHLRRAALKNGADLVVVLLSVIHIQLAHSCLQLLDAVLIAGGPLIVILLDKDNLHAVIHKEAGGVGGPHEEGVALQGGTLGIAVDRRGGHAGLVVLGVLEQDILLVVDGFLNQGNIVHVLVAGAGGSVTQSGGGQLSAHDLALGVVLDLVPVVLLHVTVAGAVAQVGQLVADFLDLGLLAADSDLADPGPLVGVGVVGLLVHAAAGDIHQVLAGGGVVSHGHRGDHIAVALVEHIGAPSGSSGLITGGGNFSVLITGILGGLLSHGGIGGIVVVQNLKAGILHTGGNAAHLVDDSHMTIVVGVNGLNLNSQIHAVVVAVNLIVAVAGGSTFQRHVLLVDVQSVRILLLGNLDALIRVDGAGNQGQGVDAVLIHGVGAPRVHQSIGSQAGAALGDVEDDRLHLAVQEDGVGLPVGGGQVALVGINAGDEHVVVSGSDQINTDQVAVLIKIEVVALLFQVDLTAGVLVQHLEVVLGGVGVVVGGAVGHHVAVLLERGQGDITHHLGGG